ncbi:MAG: DUF427 domain-containing protein [Patescibacteria group bacterium]|nr:DUF427 domain-containing protein [Patescibacteria group bacterium]
MKAIWNNRVIAESDDTVVVEGNHYFPRESVKMEYLAKNGDTYTCPWKGVCDYYDVTVDGKTAKGAAFMYPDPKPEAKHIKGYFAFWQGVAVTD